MLSAILMMSLDSSRLMF